MVTEQGPKLLEYNVRFGDPETQALLPLIKSDFGDLIETITEEKLSTFPLKISTDSAIGVVVAAGGYPGKYEKEIPVDYIPKFNDKYVVVFHAATKINDDGHVVTGGGRCFTVVGLGNNYVTANSNAYQAVEEVYFKDCFHRNDIGKKFFEREN